MSGKGTRRTGGGPTQPDLTYPDFFAQASFHPRNGSHYPTHLSYSLSLLLSVFVALSQLFTLYVLPGVLLRTTSPLFLLLPTISQSILFRRTADHRLRTDSTATSPLPSFSCASLSNFPFFFLSRSFSFPLFWPEVKRTTHTLQGNYQRSPFFADHWYVPARLGSEWLQ